MHVPRQQLDSGEWMFLRIQAQLSLAQSATSQDNVAQLKEELLRLKEESIFMESLKVAMHCFGISSVRMIRTRSVFCELDSHTCVTR